MILELDPRKWDVFRPHANTIPPVNSGDTTGEGFVSAIPKMTTQIPMPPAAAANANTIPPVDQQPDPQRSSIPATQESFMATAALIPALTTHRSFLQKLGSDAKGFFAFLRSSKGQAIINSGEAVVETVAPGTAGFLNLANKWLTQIVQTEAIAAAAAAQDGTGPQKAIMVLSAVVPDALEFAKANGLPVPTAERLAVANKALVDFGNAFSAA